MLKKHVAIACMSLMITGSSLTVASAPAQAAPTRCVQESWYYADSTSGTTDRSDPRWQEAAARYQDENCSQPSGGGGGGTQWWYCEHSDPMGSGYGGSDCRPI